MGVVLRRGGTQDVRFLRDMLHHAYYWRERVPGSLVSRYVRGWGRLGDTALIALENGFPVGAAWYRVFTGDEPGYGFVDEETPELAIAVVPSKRGHGIGDEPGYGFVDEETPELAIAVVPSKRGHGIGDELLQELIAKAKAAGYGRLSLSVEPGNPARKLYERHGFEIVDEGAEAWTMVASLS
jgi:GNAT superfamily N-acetyltransferase